MGTPNRAHELEHDTPPWREKTDVLVPLWPQDEGPTVVSGVHEAARIARLHGTPPYGRASLLLLILSLVASSGFAVSWVRSLRSQSTDNAQVEGRILHVAPRVPGQVLHVHVHDNQLVEPGQILIELDHQDLDARLDAARADLAAAEATHVSAEAQLTLTTKTVAANRRRASGGVTQASAGMRASSASIAQARVDVSSATAREKQAKSDVDRAEELHQANSISSAELEAHRLTYDQARADRELAEAGLSAARASTANAAGALAVAKSRQTVAASGSEQIAMVEAAAAAATARVAQCKAALKLAELAASYAFIRAPARGVVTRRDVEVGQLAASDRPLLALVVPDDFWVVANFREDQIARLRPGQRAWVRVDALGRHDLAAHVESLANAAGNFTRIAQRVPVLLRLEDPKGLPLRPGLSAVVTVETR